MPYDQFTADRVTRILEDKKVNFRIVKMMGGLCYMVNEKMACGIHYWKKKETDLLMARVGPHNYGPALKKKGGHPMDFTGRTMKGFIHVTPDGYDSDAQLEYWIDLCLDYNPHAPVSKKKKKK